jgi:hypothetical protein
MAERLLAIMDGSLGRRLEDNTDNDPILIGIGLGQFMSNSRLSSLHSSFLEYFIKVVSFFLFFLSKLLTMRTLESTKTNTLAFYIFRRGLRGISLLVLTNTKHRRNAQDAPTLPPK